MNLQEQFSAALILAGERSVPAKTQKYLVYTRAAGGFWYLGKSGAVRYGTTASGSFSAGEKTKAKILGKME